MTNLVERQFSSVILGNNRSLWTRTPPEDILPELQLILLDAEYYLRMPSLWNQIERLESDGAIPATRVVLVSHLDDTTRRSESVCYPPFADFVATELIPGTQSKGNPVPTILGGLSLSGLSAAHAAICHPARIDGVLCQSPSLWWSAGKIIKIAAEQTPLQTVWRICVGNEETNSPVDHGPGLLQIESQVSSCQRFRDHLQNRGVTISYEEYAGGHRLDAWERDLSVSLREIVSLIQTRKSEIDAD